MNAFANLASRYGQSLILHRDGGEPAAFRAFLQKKRPPLAAPPLSPTPLGAVSEERWTCFSPQALSPGDRIGFGSLLLVVQEAHTHYLGDEAVYCLATLQRRKEAAT